MCVFVLLCAVTFFLAAGKNEIKLWDDYFIIAVPEGQAESAAARICSTEKLRAEAVTEYNTEFIFNDFGRDETVKLTDLEERFVEGDPRVDPFMENAASFFHTVTQDGAGRELIYVKSGLKGFSFYYRIKKIFGEETDSWVFPDFRLENRLYPLLLFAVCCFFVILLLKGLRIPAIAASLPWIAAIAANGAGILPAAVAVYIFTAFLVRETFSDMLYYLNYRQIKVGRNFLVYASAFIVSIFIYTILNYISEKPVLPVFTAVAADAVFFLIFYSIKSQKVRMQEHRLFFPVSISTETENEYNVRKLPETAAAAAAVIILPMFMLFFNDNVSLEIPKPEKSENALEWNWENLEYLNKTGEGLINASDYITHRAFQDGFMYDRDYVFPLRGESLMQGSFVSENNEILYREYCIRQFTDEWYTSIISQGSKTGLTALLLSQKSPGGISITSDISDTAGGFNPVRHIIAGLLAFIPLTGQLLIKVRITVRRKGQEA